VAEFETETEGVTDAVLLTVGEGVGVALGDVIAVNNSGPSHKRPLRLQNADWPAEFRADTRM